LQNDRVYNRGVKVERPQRDQNFAGIQDERENRPPATGNDRAAPCVKGSDCFIQCFAALNKRLPFGRIRETRDHAREETKHPEALDKIKTANSRNADNNSNQCRTDEVLLTGRVYQEHDSKQGKRGLSKDAQGKIDKDRSGSRRHRTATNRSQACANKIAANSSRRHERAD